MAVGEDPLTQQMVLEIIRASIRKAGGHWTLVMIRRARELQQIFHYDSNLHIHQECHKKISAMIKDPE